MQRSVGKLFRRSLLCGVLINACSEISIPPMAEVGDTLHFIMIVYLCPQDIYVVQVTFLVLYFILVCR